MRGRYQKADDTNEGCEVDSNFIQLLRTRAEDNPSILRWLKKSRDKFTSPDIQNEILAIMGKSILRDISAEVSGKWFTIMVDETVDLRNKEQMVFCLRYVDDNFEVHEEFIGLYTLDLTSAELIFATIKDILLRMDFSRGQCFDGAKVVCPV